MPALVDPLSRTAADSSEIDMLRARLRAAESALLQERAEKERLRSELELRDAALNAANTHFLIVDAREPDKPIVYSNRALARDHGYEPAELLGQPAHILLPAEEALERAAQISAELRAGRSIRLEMQVQRRGGSLFWFGCQIVPVRNAAGVITHHVTVGADITGKLEAERRKQELQDQLLAQMAEREKMAMELRLAQKLEAVGRLAAGLAHEINTPIQYVGDSIFFLRSAFEDLSRLFEAYRAAAALLAGVPDAGPLVERIAVIGREIDVEFLGAEVPRAFARTLEGTERVAAIVRAMKDFAHPDGQEHSPADLNKALETTLVVAHNEYKYTAAVVTDLCELPAVVCNVGELNQVFLNLIVNAAHAIADAGRSAADGRITVQTRIVGPNAQVIIGDNGCGIPAQNVEKIFDPFFTTKEVGRGTGQGLAITRSIVVDKHGGDIRVESTVGVGSRFILTLPVAGKAAVTQI